MSTRGFVGIKHAGKTLLTYNHSDSYPTWLGTLTAKFIQAADLEEVARQFAALTPVNESDEPTPEQMQDLKNRGFWMNVSTGNDWYAALRNAQGQIGQYLLAGYLPVLSNAVLDNPGLVDAEWGYVIDLDEGSLMVGEATWGEKGMRRTFIPLARIRNEIEGLEPYDIEREMAAIENAS